jgi:hypothetical protein
MESKLIQDPNLKMHLIQFVSMMMMIQMILMKVGCRHENMTIQKFQLDRELKLIQAMNMQMPPIQFVSMMTAIQTKVMKVIGKS